MGRRNSVPENRDLQSLNFVTRTLCIFGGRWRTRLQNNAWGGRLCRWGGGLAGRWGTLYLTKKPGSQMETTSVCITFIFAFLKLCYIWKEDFYLLNFMMPCYNTFLRYLLSITILKLTICCQHAKCCHPFSWLSQTTFQHIWCASQAQFPCYIGVQRGPGQAPCKVDTIWWQNVFQHGSWNYISQPFIYTDNKDYFGLKFAFLNFDL